MRSPVNPNAFKTFNTKNVKLWFNIELWNQEKQFMRFFFPNYRNTVSKLLPSWHHILHYGLSVVPHYMLIFFWWSTESLFAILTPMWIVFCVYWYYMSFKARRICSAIFAILALINFSSTVGLHVLLKFSLLPKSSFTPFALKRQVLGVNWEDVPAQYKRIWRFKVTVSTLMYLFTFMGFTMLFELWWTMEAFLTYLAFVGKILCMNWNNVSLQVTGVGALMVTVWTLMSLMPLKQFCVLLQLLFICKSLGTVLTFKRQVIPVFGFDMSFQIGLISTPEDTVLTLVWLFPSVGPHMLFQLWWMTESFPTLHTYMREVLTVHCK